MASQNDGLRLPPPWITPAAGKPDREVRQVIIVQRRRGEGAAYHPEATAWQARVASNGGSASTATMRAVSDFCTAIDAASGLRAAIARLNLFCGDNLSAALVPLYLATSSGGATVGNSTDTNNNFASGDYADTGSNGGLKGNGTTKYLDTGVAQNAVSGTSCHLSVSGAGFLTTTDNVSIGAFNGAAENIHDILHSGDVLGTGTMYCAYRPAAFTLGAPKTANLQVNEIHLLGTKTSSTAATLYRGGNSVNSVNELTTPAFVSNRSYYVFALNSSGTAVGHTPARLRMYSIGAGINATQAAAFASAVATFNSALGR